MFMFVVEPGTVCLQLEAWAADERHWRLKWTDLLFPLRADCIAMESAKWSRRRGLEP